jgi:MFS family permease
MGMIGAAIGLGFVVGPAIGGLLSPLGPAVPFMVAMAVAIVNALLVITCLSETHKKRDAAKTGSPTKKGSGLGQLLRNTTITRFIMINLLFTMAFTAMEAVFALFSQHTFGWTAKENGYIFTYVGFIVVIMQGGLVGQLVKRIGERTLLIAGLVMLATGLALLPWSTSLAFILVALALVSAGNGAVTPTTSALLSLASPREAQGETLGFAQGIASVGRIVGPLAAGSRYSLVGPGVPFLMGSVLTILAILIALTAMPESRKVRATEAIAIEKGEVEEMKTTSVTREP